MQALMKLLLKETRDYDSTYRAPVPTTPASRQLFTTTISRSPAVKNKPVEEYNELAGTKEFENMEEYRTYMQDKWTNI